MGYMVETFDVLAYRPTIAVCDLMDAQSSIAPILMRLNEIAWKQLHVMTRLALILDETKEYTSSERRTR